eukprot:TRINITY_DN1836_c0_g2_i1.p1 TRINITY_DN1836_c0_g2~~TRINITY_DN1836_c0_g2_i1.p1  ORF type:complete len:464 (+),score=148.67 TRINITY_DN1836_c0_g2_i1:61-1392(+)
MSTPKQSSRVSPNTPPTLRLDDGDVGPDTPQKGARRYRPGVAALPPEALDTPTLSESPDLTKNKRRVTARHGAYHHQQSGHSRTTTSGANNLRTSFHHRGIPLTASLRSGNQSISEGTPGTPFSLLRPTSPNSTCSTRVNQMMGWFASQFRVTRELGSGQYGHVVLAKHGLDDQSYAVKVIDTAVSSQFDLRRRITEARVLAKCNSPYIMRYYSCWLEESHIYIQTEFCSGGTLASRMEAYRKAGQRWEEAEVTAILRQIAIALSHLHGKVNAVHLDIKPDNIYIGADKRYKLGDFGHAHFLDDDSNGVTVTAMTRISCDKSLDSMVSRPDYRFSVEEGDIRYLPLEMLNDKTRLREADIFSLGVSLYEAASGLQLPNGSDPRWRRLRETGVDRELLRHWYTTPFISVIELMMSPDLGKRPTTSQLISYPGNAPMPPDASCAP